MQNFNLSAQPFIPAVEAQQNSVPNMQEPRVTKSVDGKEVKNSSTTEKVCFQCKQPGHLKKDCPELLYCSKCRTKGHVPMKCPLEEPGQAATGQKMQKQQRNKQKMQKSQRGLEEGTRPATVLKSR